MEALADPKADWLRQTGRVIELIDNQVRSLRKRQLIDSFKRKGSSEDGARSGAYWGISTDIANYHLADSLDAPVDKTSVLAKVPIRLKGLGANTQERLINWGYAVCDAAMRKHFDQGASPPQGFPYPGEGVG